MKRKQKKPAMIIKQNRKQLGPKGKRVVVRTTWIVYDRRLVL